MLPVKLITEAGSARLIVDCYWTDDRYSHALLLRVGNDDPITLLRSIEGNSVDFWPPSPPIQEVTPAAESDALLGLGMAGKSHWSVSIGRSIAAPCITWELACRTTEQPLQLGSSYSTECEVEQLQGETTNLLLRVKTTEVQLVCSRGTQAMVASSQLCFRPAAKPSSLPTTVCWSYQASVLG